MKEALEKLIQEHWPLPGLAAWGARLSDKSLASHCYMDSFDEAQVGRVVSRMAAVVEGLAHHQIEPVRLCWVFKHARVHLALGRDGSCVAFFMENRPGLSTAKLDQVLGKFRELSARPRRKWF